MITINLDKMSKIQGGISGAACFFVGIGLFTPIIGPFLGNAAIKCWNS